MYNWNWFLKCVWGELLMNSKEIKHKIALSCNGDMKKYFEKVAIVNKLLYTSSGFSDIDLINRVEDMYLKNKTDLKQKTIVNS